MPCQNQRYPRGGVLPVPSKLKSDTARANGAKSHGPVTPEGRAKSSANSRSHGLTAKYKLLPDESSEEFELLINDYIDQFEPRTAVEMDLIEVMAIARWRLRRFLAMESQLFDVEIVRSEKQIDREFNNMNEVARLAWVFQKMADKGHSIAMLIRYEGSLNRSYDKALKQLLLLQSRRQSPPPSPTNTKIQNEPKPDPQPDPDSAVQPDPAAVSEARPSGSACSYEPRPGRPLGRVVNWRNSCDVGISALGGFMTE